jgi:cysteinyl-tRNA synthetase
MAKSEGTGFAVSEIVEHGFKPMALRFFFLSAHYRSKQNFTWEALQGSATALERLTSQLINMEMSVGQIAPDFRREFVAQISNDFNIPGALAVVWDLIKSPDVSSADKLATVLDFDRVLGLNLADQIDKEQPLIEITPELQEVLDEREQARLHKDWQLADQLRDKLATEYGVSVKDTAAGQQLTRLN